MSERQRVLRLIRLGLERDRFPRSAAEALLEEAKSLPSEAVRPDLLVERGLLTDAELARLLETLQTAEAATLRPDGSPSDAKDASEAGHHPSIPGYKIVRLLGRGGMGVVYEAVQDRPKRHVALKVLPSGRFPTPEQRRRFEREAQAAADLNHPGIVTIYEFGEVDGSPYFTMELVEGEPLHRHLRRSEPTLREKLELMRQVCDAVAYAHQRGVIHRDLKPANIVVTAEGAPKVLDFGLAKLTEGPTEEALRTLTLRGRFWAPCPTWPRSKPLVDPRTWTCEPTSMPWASSCTRP